MSSPTGDTARDAKRIQEDLLEFLEQRTKQGLSTDTDLFESGLVSSMFAMELLVHIEKTFGVAVSGPELKLANFRSVDAMTSLVLRLGGDAGD